MSTEVVQVPTKMTFVLSDEVREALQQMAREQRRSMTGVIEYLILNPDEVSERQLREAYEKGYEEAKEEAEKGYEEAGEEGYEKGREKG